MNKAKIYFAKPEYFTALNNGLDFMTEKLIDNLGAGNIEETHKLLEEYSPIKINHETIANAKIDLEEIYCNYQGENWPMSVGDIVVYENNIYFCDTNGWENITQENYTGLLKVA